MEKNMKKLSLVVVLWCVIKPLSRLYFKTISYLIRVTPWTLFPTQHGSLLTSLWCEPIHISSLWECHALVLSLLNPWDKKLLPDTFWSPAKSKQPHFEQHHMATFSSLHVVCSLELWWKAYGVRGETSPTLGHVTRQHQDPRCTGAVDWRRLTWHTFQC